MHKRKLPKITVFRDEAGAEMRGKAKISIDKRIFSAILLIETIEGE